MRIRTVRCPADAHPLPWVKAEDCEHWSLICERSRKAKKPRHKLTRDAPGFEVDMTGIDEKGWPYACDPPAYALELTPKRFLGTWQRTWPGTHWTPAPMGNRVTCATGCGLMAGI